MLTMHGGLGLDHSCFRPWLDSLGADLEVVYYDHAGNGESPAPESWESYSFERLADDAEALRKESGLGSILLFGHGFGGFVAQEYAFKYANNLRGLILCSTSPRFDHTDVALERATVRGTQRELRALLALMATPVPDDAALQRLWRKAAPTFFHRPMPQLIAEVGSSIRFRARPWNLSLHELAPVFDATDRLGSIEVPTLAIAGRHDWLMPVDVSAQRICELVPNCDVEIIDEAGHFPWMEQPEQFLSIIRRWIARI